MPESLFQRAVVPVVNGEDARTTATALAPYPESAGGRCLVMHVIEKASGAPDRASIEQRKLRASDIFEIVNMEFSKLESDTETKIQYGSGIVAPILDAATDVDASAIVFTPRGVCRWVKLLAGDITTALVNESPLPILVLPDTEANRV